MFGQISSVKISEPEEIYGVDGIEVLQLCADMMTKETF